MSRQVTKEEQLAWKDRWDLVNEFEIEELRRMSPDDKLRDLAILMAMVRECGWEESLAAEKAAGRENWLKLYKAYGVC
jgi:hypothetical protein